MARAIDAKYRLAMCACPRHGCGGSLMEDFDGRMACHLCAWPVPPPRPPTAEEKRSRGRGAEQEPDYFSGIYHVDYVPTAEEMSRAIW